MHKPARFLLIDGTGDRYWPQVVKEALKPLGKVQIKDEAEALEALQHRPFDVVLVDTMVARDVPALVGEIRSQCPEARVILATASPTWMLAREAFQAGAMDYIRKSLDHGEIQSVVHEAMEKSPPPWP